MADLKTVDISQLTKQLHSEAANACEGIRRTAEKMIAEVETALEGAKILTAHHTATDLLATAEVAAITDADVRHSFGQGQVQLVLWGNLLGTFDRVDVAEGKYRALLFLVKK